MRAKTLQLRAGIFNYLIKSLAFFILILATLHPVKAQDAFMGYDYETSSYPLAWSTSPTTFNAGTDREIIFSNSGGGINSATVCNTSSISNYQLNGSNAYIELSLTSNSANSTFTVTFTGSTNNNTTAANAGVVYSDQIPFSETSVIGADAVPFPAAQGSWIKLNVTPPAGAKSLRIYRRIYFNASNNTIYTSSGSGRVQYGDGTTIRTASVAAWVTPPAPTSAPTIQAKDIAFSNVTPTSMDINWTRGDGGSVAVFVKEGSQGTITNPADGTEYTASTDWDTKADQLGSSGYYNVYSGNGTSVTLTGLSPTTTYWVQAFEYNGTGTNTLFLTTTATGNPNSQLTLAPTPTILVSPTTLAFDDTKINTSKELTYTLSADFLSPASGDITVTAPAGYEVSLTSGSGFSSSLLIPYTASTLAPTTVYVRFSPTAEQAYNGTLTNAGGSAPSANVDVTGAGIVYAVGDYGSHQDGPWNTAATWRRWDGTGFNSTASSAPGATDDVFIVNNVVVTLTSNVSCRNLILQSGQVKGDATVFPTGTIRAINVSNNGSVIINGGVLGSINLDFTETNVSVNANGNISIGGTGGTARFSRIRCNNAAGDWIVSINRDIELAYTGSTGNGGMAINSVASSGNSPGGTKTFIIEEGATVTLPPNAYLGAETSASGNSKLNTSFVINGTLEAGHGNNVMNLRTEAGFTNSLVIGATGIANIGALHLNGLANTITLENDGVLNLGSATGGNIDFTNTAGEMFITGSGTTNIIGGTLLIGSADGITATASAGPIRTTTRNYAVDARYAYVGSAAQVTGDGLPSTVEGFIINNSEGVRLQDHLTATSALTVTAGPLFVTAGKTIFIPTGATANFNNQRVVLESNATGTAGLGEIAGTLSGATNVTVERFIPANDNRAWRLLAVPFFATDSTIYTSWQEGGATTSGYGTHITQTGGAGTDGFDASTTSNTTSIAYFNGSAVVPPNNTDIAKVTDNGGAWFVFVAGDRNIDVNSTSASSNTTLRVNGTINHGDVVNAGVAGTDFSIIPNPYPSAIDFEAVRAGNGDSLDVFYVWDANLGSLGGYRTVNRTAINIYEQTPSAGIINDYTARYIQSGQAFFIPENLQLNFSESMKTEGMPANNVFRTGTPGEEITVNLNLKDGTANTLADGVRVKFDDTYSATVTLEDIAKLNNFTENLSIMRDNVNLSVERRPFISANDTIFLRLTHTTSRLYSFMIEPFNLSASGLEAFLEDAYLSTFTPVSLSAPTEVDFAVTADAASASPDRFRIVIRPGGPLSVSAISIKATQKENAVQVDWIAMNEKDMAGYEVERSANGRDYIRMAAFNAKANDGSNANYRYIDALPLHGENYYRIKATAKTSTIQYSPIARVKVGGVKAEIAVYPNPVKGEVIMLQMNNMKSGLYTLQLFNNLGQQVYQTNIKHDGGSAAKTINLAPALKAKGTYSLRIIGADTMITQSIISQ